jgi:ribosomal-protein-alanine N-acetyltransferase
MTSPGDKVGNASSIAVRRMSSSDVPNVVSILKESPEAPMWSGESLLESASRGLAWVNETDGAISGVLIGRVAADEFEILNLGIRRAYRRRGIATQLVIFALEHARTAGACLAYLEVRASNEGGIALYTGLGFRTCGRRPNYYHDPVEDALLMVFHIQQTS